MGGGGPDRPTRQVGGGVQDGGSAPPPLPLSFGQRHRPRKKKFAPNGPAPKAWGESVSPAEEPRKTWPYHLGRGPRGMGGGGLRTPPLPSTPPLPFGPPLPFTPPPTGAELLSQALGRAEVP